MPFRLNRTGIVLAIAIAMIAVPGSARAADTPVSIVSSAKPVAVGEHLSIDSLKVRNNTDAMVAKVDVRFDLIKVSPFDADAFGFERSVQDDDEACPPGGDGIQDFTAVCSYQVNVPAGATASITVRLRLSARSSSATAASPLLKITVGTDTTTVGPITRVERVADLSVRITGQPIGRVGAVVNVQYVVTNQGPDPVPNVALTRIAPSGAEWIGPAPNPVYCDVRNYPKTTYRCVDDRPLAPGHTLTGTWQLKIDESVTGTGDVSVASNLYLGTPDPYLDITDPNPANNATSFAVVVDTSTTSDDPTSTPASGEGGAGPGSAPTASPPPAVTAATSAPEPGPETSDPTEAGPSFVLASSNGILVGTLGTIVLIVGALLGLVSYRRRARSTSTLDTATAEEAAAAGETAETATARTGQD